MEKKIFSDEEVFELQMQGPLPSLPASQQSWAWQAGLGGLRLSQDPVVEVEVEMEKGPLDTRSIRQEMEEYIVLEEDSEMYAMAGIQLVPVPVQERIESTIRQAMSSVPTVNGVTVNVKIVVLNYNSGNLTY
jgi:hypothetical protein